MTTRQISIAGIENTIKLIFQRKNILNINILINTSNSNTTIASVIGLNLSDFAGLYSYVNINLHFNRLHDYDDDELFFILSHECAHVFYNHIWQNIFWFGLENMVRGKNNENAVYVDL